MTGAPPVRATNAGAQPAVDPGASIAGAGAPAMASGSPAIGSMTAAPTGTPPGPNAAPMAGVSGATPAMAASAVASFLNDASWEIDCAATPPAKPECSLPVSAGSEWTIEKILKLSRQEVTDLWSKAPPAEVGELDGEYVGLAPTGGDSSAQSAIVSTLYNENGNMGYWLGKTYKPAPEGDTKGEGYNRWRRSNKQTNHTLRFATRPDTSLIDSKPAFMMFYNAFNPSMTLTDELRRIDAHVYIGMATMQAGSGRTPPDQFVLVGPMKPWSEF